MRVIQVYALTSNAEKLKLNGSVKTYKTFLELACSYLFLENYLKKEGRIGEEETNIQECY